MTGQTAADSRVVASTEIRDGFQPPHSYQIQYLWDTAIGGDDGPVVQPRAAGTPYRPFDPTIGVEQTVAGDAELAAVDNDRNAASPTFAVALSGLDNPQAVPGSVKYVCWADAIFAPLGGYVTDSTRDISGPGSNCLNQTGSADSAALFLWSAGGAAGEVKVAASLRMSPPTPHATTMAAGPISLGSATARLTDTATGRPVSGRTVTFKTGSQLRCTKITDADGKASCGGLLGGLLGYDVTYTGGAIWAGSTAHGGL